MRTPLHIQDFIDVKIYPILKDLTPFQFIESQPEIIEELLKLQPQLKEGEKLLYWLKFQRKKCLAPKEKKEKVIKPIKDPSECLKIKKEKIISKVIEATKISKTEIKELKNIQKSNQSKLTELIKEQNIYKKELNQLLTLENSTEEQEERKNELRLKLEELDLKVFEIKDIIKKEYLNNREGAFKESVLYHIYKEVEDFDNIELKLREAKQNALHYVQYYKEDQEKEILARYKSIEEDFKDNKINADKYLKLIEGCKTQMELVLKESLIKQNKASMYFRAIELNNKLDNKLLNKIRSVSEIFNNFKEQKQEEKPIIQVNDVDIQQIEAKLIRNTELENLKEVES